MAMKCVCVCVCVSRIHEKGDHQLSFKQVASGFMSRGYLDPTDGQLEQYIQQAPLYMYRSFLWQCLYWIPGSMCLCGLGRKQPHTKRVVDSS